MAKKKTSTAEKPVTGIKLRARGASGKIVHMHLQVPGASTRIGEQGLYILNGQGLPVRFWPTNAFEPDSIELVYD